MTTDSALSALVRLGLAALLTVGIEAPFLTLVLFRELKRGKILAAFIPVCVLANLATNVALNVFVLAAAMALATGAGGLRPAIWFVVYPLEAAAVAAEYACYRALLGGSSKLFLLTLAANALSYGAGVLIFGHV